MKHILPHILVLALCLMMSCSWLPGTGEGPAYTSRLLICGSGEVFALDMDNATGTVPPLTWSWRADDDAAIPDSLRDAFRAINECKPVRNNEMMLVTSSGGGVALVDISSREAVFSAYVPHAQTAELLPDGLVAVAGSTGDNGNCVALFSLDRPGVELYRDELYSTHGIVWDDSRDVLWVLGYDELRMYRCRGGDTASPELELMQSFPLGGEGGHDLRAIRGTDFLIVTDSKVWLFDRRLQRFIHHPNLGDMNAVNSVDYHPVTGRIVYIQTEAGKKAANAVTFMHPVGEILLTGEKLRKARWLVRGQ